MLEATREELMANDKPATMRGPRPDKRGGYGSGSKLVSDLAPPPKTPGLGAKPTPTQK